MEDLNQRIANWRMWERKEMFKQALYARQDNWCMALDAALWDGAWFDLAALEECLDRILEGELSCRKS